VQTKQIAVMAKFQQGEVREQPKALTRKLLGYFQTERYCGQQVEVREKLLLIRRARRGQECHPKSPKFL
jgi:hypothetical protein